MNLFFMTNGYQPESNMLGKQNVPLFLSVFLQSTLKASLLML